MKNLVYVGFKFNHMGPHAGYDLIKQYAGYHKIIDCQKSYNNQQKFYSKKNILSRIHGKLFGGYMWWIEIRCLLTAIFEKNTVFHFIYAENTYRFLGYFKWLGFKIVCTYHQPASFFKSNPEYLFGIRFVDEIIVLSEDARAIFTSTIESSKVHFIPHGVDCEYFRPDLFSQNGKEVLMVGNWLRNFKFAAEVFYRLLKKDLTLNIHVVTSKDNHSYFKNHERLFLHSGITDEELLLRYQSASLLFLPLDGFVANNAALEMSAVGSPVLIASNQKPEESLKDLVEYIPLNLNTVENKIIEITNKKFIDKKNKIDIVTKRFSWPVIGKITNLILNKS